ncbi:killer cell lectin-like receptor subfamily B member 1 [Cheilinus undulatus]|uniref:killer cell lectin-like receptor subfamily B member 1 n=1 Tax=Cheilinus undulatus TaxID=241271 RepID=UPI001BD3CAFE|nr:killer cell lectin-like receptor subfamily B member 1 [Cheilinus undulatus]
MNGSSRMRAQFSRAFPPIFFRRPVLASVSRTPAVTKPVGIETSAEVKPETWPLFKVSTVCLGLLCLLLLTAVLAVSVLYDRDFYQLSRDLANQTAEKHQLLIQNQNLTDERESAKLQLNNPMKTVGADLVITNSQREMMFLNKFGANLKFWIGLNQASSKSNWKWTDGSSLKTGDVQLLTALQEVGGILGHGLLSHVINTCSQSVRRKLTCLVCYGKFIRHFYNKYVSNSYFSHT